MHGPGQQVQYAPPGSSHSGLIDPCNLFIKVRTASFVLSDPSERSLQNLDTSIDSNGLFSHFRQVRPIICHVTS